MCISHSQRLHIRVRVHACCLSPSDCRGWVCEQVVIDERLRALKVASSLWSQCYCTSATNCKWAMLPPASSSGTRRLILCLFTVIRGKSETSKWREKKAAEESTLNMNHSTYDRQTYITKDKDVEVWSNLCELLFSKSWPHVLFMCFCTFQNIQFFVLFVKFKWFRSHMNDLIYSCQAICEKVIAPQPNDCSSFLGGNNCNQAFSI